MKGNPRLIQVKVYATLLIDLERPEHLEALADCLDEDGVIDLDTLADFIGEDFTIDANIPDVEETPPGQFQFGWDYEITAEALAEETTQ